MTCYRLQITHHCPKGAHYCPKGETVVHDEFREMGLSGVSGVLGAGGGGGRCAADGGCTVSNE